MRPGVPSFFPLFIGCMGHLFCFLFWLVFFFINAGFSFYRFSKFWDHTWLVSFYLFMFFILSTPFQAFCVLGARSWLKPQDQQVGRRWFAKFFVWLQWLQVRWKGAGSRGPWCDSPFCKVWFHCDVMWYGWWKKSCTSWYGILPHYLQGFIHVRWCRISSVNSIMGFESKIELKSSRLCEAAGVPHISVLSSVADLKIDDVLTCWSALSFAT